MLFKNAIFWSDAPVMDFLSYRSLRPPKTNIQHCKAWISWIRINRPNWIRSETLQKAVLWIRDFWYGSGSEDPWLWPMDPDPAIFVLDPRDANKNYFFYVFLPITFWKYIYIIFLREKVIKKSQNSRNQSFSYYCSLMIEGSGSGEAVELLTNGSGAGSGRPRRHTDPDPKHCRKSVKIRWVASPPYSRLSWGAATVPAGRGRSRRAR